VLLAQVVAQQLDVVDDVGVDVGQGNTPHTWQPIGSYRQAIKGGVAYWLVKVSDRDPERADAANARLRDWRFVHRLVYETEVAPIPPGYVVILLDGDPDNCLDPGNLACLSRAELVRLNQMGWANLPTDRAVRRAAVARAQLIHAAHDAARRGGLSLQERRRLLPRDGIIRPNSDEAAARALASRYQPQRQHPET